MATITIEEGWAGGGYWTCEHGDKIGIGVDASNLRCGCRLVVLNIAARASDDSGLREALTPANLFLIFNPDETASAPHDESNPVWGYWKKIADKVAALSAPAPQEPAPSEGNERARDLTEQQVQDIHRIIERWSTDVVDYENAADDINAYLFGGIAQPEAAPSEGNERARELSEEIKRYVEHEAGCDYMRGAPEEGCSCGAWAFKQKVRALAERGKGERK